MSAPMTPGQEKRARALVDSLPVTEWDSKDEGVGLLAAALEQAQREGADDLERLFALQQTRMQKATAMWREATGQHEVSPDLGDLLDWLMSSAAQEREQAEQAESRFVECEGVSLLRKKGGETWERQAHEAEARIEELEQEVRDWKGLADRTSTAIVEYGAMREKAEYKLEISDVRIEVLEKRLRDLCLALEPYMRADPSDVIGTEETKMYRQAQDGKDKR